LSRPSVWFAGTGSEGVNHPVAAWPPLNVYLLAAYVPPEDEVEVIDENIHRLDTGSPYELVGITVVTAAALRAYEIADLFRARGIPVVLGGPHVSALPDEAREHADAVVTGEGDKVWPQVIEDARAGTLKPIYQGGCLTDLAGLPYPRRDLIGRSAYLIPDIIQTSRGCPHKCEFCYLSTPDKVPYRTRPVGEVIGEIKAMPPGRFLMFADDNLTADLVYAKELFRAMIPLKRRWIAQTTVKVADDPELLELMARSGCHSVLWGLESIRPESLAAAGKRTNRAEDYTRAFRALHGYGILGAASFVFGFDGETPAVFPATIEAIRKMKCDLPIIYDLTPLPGTSVYRTLTAAGRVSGITWDRYTYYNVVFRPRDLTADELTTGFRQAWQALYTPWLAVTRGVRALRLILVSWRYQRGAYVWADLKLSLRFFRLYHQYAALQRTKKGQA